MAPDRFALPLALLTVALAGCVDVTRRDAELERLAQRLSDVADQCLLDVRDNRQRYEDSRNCAALGEASRDYLRPGVELTYSGQAVPRHAHTAQVALKTAWIAAALSNAFHPNQPRTVRVW